MSKSSVLVGNVYVMMAYAFRALSLVDGVPQATTEFEHVHDLLAEIIAQETAKQVKRGLDHCYVQQSEELATVRGRIDMQSSLRSQSFVRGKLVCRYDEYVADTPVNQAVRATILMLARCDSVTEPRQQALSRLLPFFDGVAAVSPRMIRWADIGLHRQNSSYRFLVNACELAVKGLLPKDGAGESLLPWLDEDAMSSLFERFVREYFRFHHPELGVSAAHIPWNVADPGGLSPVGTSYLPRMRTDITLQRGTDTLIVDTKFYSDSMQDGRFGKATFHSGNLYQLSTYVQHAAATRPHVAGLLLYAKTDGHVQPELDAMIAGHRLGATTLNLAQPWPKLQQELENLLTRF